MSGWEIAGLVVLALIALAIWAVVKIVMSVSASAAEDFERKQKEEAEEEARLAPKRQKLRLLKQRAKRHSNLLDPAQRRRHVIKNHREILAEGHEELDEFDRWLIDDDWGQLRQELGLGKTEEIWEAMRQAFREAGQVTRADIESFKEEEFERFKDAREAREAKKRQSELEDERMVKEQFDRTIEESIGFLSTVIREKIGQGVIDHTLEKGLDPKDENSHRTLLRSAFLVPAQNRVRNEASDPHSEAKVFAMLMPLYKSPEALAALCVEAEKEILEGVSRDIACGLDTCQKAFSNLGYHYPLDEWVKPYYDRLGQPRTKETFVVIIKAYEREGWDRFWKQA